MHTRKIFNRDDDDDDSRCDVSVVRHVASASITHIAQ